MSYPVLCGAVVLTSANNRLRFREAAGAVGNVDLDVGTYYLRGGYTTNLLLQSEALATSWLQWQISTPSNVIASPTGTITAEKIVPNTISDAHGVRQSVSLTSLQNTLSFYAKKAEYSIVNVWAFSGNIDNTNTRAAFDLSSGLVSFTNSGQSASIEYAGDGWYRCSVSIIVTAAGSPTIHIGPTTSSIVQIYTGDGTSGVFIWGAQLEAGASVGPYVATTTASATGPADELSLQIKNKLDAFGVGGNAYDVTIARSIDPTTPHTRMTITRSAGTDTFGLVVDGSQTFDMALIGFPASTPNDALAKVSTVACAASWACNDVAREIEPVSERVVAVPRAVSGRVQGVTRSARMQSWRLGLAFVDERRMLVERGLTVSADTLEGFMERFGANASLELHEAQVSTGTTLGAVSATTFVDVVHFSEDALSRFEPVRIGPGVPLYSLDLRLHAKV